MPSINSVRQRPPRVRWSPRCCASCACWRCHADSNQRPELIPAVRSQSERLLDVVEIQAELHPQDLARLQAIARDPTDPADHSGRPAR
jgi:hypothetical protein